MKKLNFVLIVLTAIIAIGCKKDLLPEGQAVDLGLSVLWSNMNVGATDEYDPGVFFAWGETYSKKIYTLPTYTYCTFGYGTSGIVTWHKYFFGYTGTASSYPDVASNLDNHNGHGSTTDNLKVLQSSDDAATANWGNGWRTPTPEEWQELIDGCDWSYNSNGAGTPYYKVAGKNGNSIIISFGDFAHLSPEYQGICGCYWTNSLSEKFSAIATDVYLSNSMVVVRNQDNATYGGRRRDYGLCIRPVKKK